MTMTFAHSKRRMRSDLDPVRLKDLFPVTPDAKNWDPGLLIHYVWNYSEAESGEATFYTGEKRIFYTRASLVFLKAGDHTKMISTPPKRPSPVIIYVDDPRRYAAELAKNFHRPPGLVSTVGGVRLYDTAVLGKNVILGPGAVIGYDGFGAVPNGAGGFYNFPHLGQVVIGDNVAIQANTTIDRGVLSDTQIGPGTMMDNQVHIGHNSKIGKNVLIASGATIGGSVTIGDGAWVGLNATIAQGVTIGKGAIVGMAANVRKDIPSGVTVVGNNKIIPTSDNPSGVIR